MAKLDEQTRAFDTSLRALDRKLQDSWHEQNQRNDDLKNLLELDHDTAVETADILGAGLHSLRGDVDALLQWGTPVSVDRLRAGALTDVDTTVAAALNRAGEVGGFADQAGVFFHPMVTLQWAPGRAWIAEVTARSVVNPFLIRVMGGIETVQVLDVTNGDLSLDLAIAGMGHHVSVADHDQLPLEHPRLDTVQLAPDWAQVAPFDAVMAVATEPGAPPIDGAWLGRLQGLVRPEGVLALALAVGAGTGTDGTGTDAVGGSGREGDGDSGVMTRAEVLKNLDGWELSEDSVAFRRTACTWDVVAGSDAPDDAGIVLIAARRSR
jgi:hypothetical protein